MNCRKLLLYYLAMVSRGASGLGSNGLVKVVLTVHDGEAIQSAGAFGKSDRAWGKRVAFSRCFDTQTTVPSARRGPRHPLGHERIQIGFLALCATVFLGIWGLSCVAAHAGGTTIESRDDPGSVEFFEQRIRPVLVEHCYECHNSHGTRESDLALDYRGGLLAGGAGGPILDREHPERSRLLGTLRHELEGLEMPEGRPALAALVIRDFERWVMAGAPDPRDQPPTATELAAEIAWPEVRQRRLAGWAFQPIQRRFPPSNFPETAADGPWQSTTALIDGWITAAWQTHGLSPSPRADAATLVRRLHLSLIGLPPTAESAQYWQTQLSTEDEAAFQRAYRALVDELLASPHFGERWARHWMDWIRYAESHGSEGDPEIVGAYHYRDYLIRSLNADVPYHQLLREHIAGDLLEQPRLNPQSGWNESRIATAHWRMVFHGFAPTDAFDEQVRFIDDQINVFSKAFLGLTVSCARCHDHKFDPIGQDDYFALFGVLRSNRAGRHVVNAPPNQAQELAALQALKPQIRSALIADWLADPAGLRERLQAWANSGAGSTTPEGQRSSETWLRQLAALPAGVDAWGKQWRETRAALQQQAAEVHSIVRKDAEQAVSGSPELTLIDRWLVNEPHLAKQIQPAGEFAIATDGQRAVAGIFPAGIYSHLLSSRLAARLTSGDLPLDQPRDLWLQVSGDGQASVRYVVRDYPRDGTVYPLVRLQGETWRWQKFDLSYWTGDQIHIELAHAQDGPLMVAGDERSWFGIRRAWLAPTGAAPPPSFDEALLVVLNAAEESLPSDLSAAIELYARSIETALTAWGDGQLSDGQALLLTTALRVGWLVNAPQQLPRAGSLIASYREREQALPTPVRVPGLVQAEVADQALMVRGDHRQLAEPVPRRFLALLPGADYPAGESGRRQLAEDLVRDDNPLTRRVIVNRLWHHLFGRGLVATTDNFGKLGEEPSHPELLDALAVEFSDRGDWSLKYLIRAIVCSQTWQRSAERTLAQRQVDPNNVYLASYTARRVEAETIRDTLLAASGSLERTLFGPAETSSEHPRRAVYTAVRRNALDRFLRTFDFPEPGSTVGRRDVTTVPAQSLTMWNDPLLQRAARELAEQVGAPTSEPERAAAIQTLYWRCFSRGASAAELAAGLAYLATVEQANQASQREREALDQERQRVATALETLAAPIRQRQQQMTASDALLDGQISDGRGETTELATPATGRVQPRWRWSFAAKPGRESEAGTTAGNGTGQLVGSARIEGGALVVDGQGYWQSSSLDQDLREKTLEVWVQLDDLNQRGGGVLSVQSLDGQLFDAVVFGERDPGQWLAGSELFNRTQGFDGELETAATTRPVQVVLVYDAEGRIHAYREGQPYGAPYRSSGPLEWRAGSWLVTLGLRHLPAGGNRGLNGRVFEARVYDRALTANEVSASFQRGIHYLTDEQILAALEPAEQTQWRQLQAEWQALEARWRALPPQPEEAAATAVWAEFAQALMMTWEFTTIR